MVSWRPSPPPSPLLHAPTSPPSSRPQARSPARTRTARRFPRRLHRDDVTSAWLFGPADIRPCERGTRDCARPARDCRRWRTQDRGRTGEDHRGGTAGAHGGPGLSARNSLILKRAATSRPSGEWNDDDFDVLADGAVVGRIMKAAAAPVGAPWLWTILSYENRQPMHGYKVTREAAMTAFAKSWRRE